MVTRSPSKFGPNTASTEVHSDARGSPPRGPFGHHYRPHYRPFTRARAACSAAVDRLSSMEMNVFDRLYKGAKNAGRRKLDDPAGERALLRCSVILLPTDSTRTIGR